MNLISFLRARDMSGSEFNLRARKLFTYQGFVFEALDPEEVHEHEEGLPHLAHVIQPGRVVRKSEHSNFS